MPREHHMIYGVRYDDCGCSDVHRHPDRASASFWASYQGGQFVSSDDGGKTWIPVERG